MSIQHVPLRDIVPNRYRKMESYRISETKIDALIQSYDNSGFWDGSIQARPHPTKADKFEIAFGHHRIEAAKRAKLGEVGLVVAKRSDADMLRMMADENREEFKGDHLVAIETVAVTIEAFERGEIELPSVGEAGPGRITLPGGKVYSLATVARFLGWVKPSDKQATNACRLAFEAYHEKANIIPALQQLPEDDRTRQATVTVLRAARVARTIAKKAHKSEAEQESAAKRGAKEAVRRIKHGEIAARVRDEASKIGRDAAGIERSPVEIDTYIRLRGEGLKVRVGNLQREVDGLLTEVWPYRVQMSETRQRVLLEVLADGDARLRDLFQKWIQRFTQTTIKNVTPRQRRLGGGR